MAEDPALDWPAVEEPVGDDPAVGGPELEGSAMVDVGSETLDAIRGDAGVPIVVFRHRLGPLGSGVLTAR